MVALSQPCSKLPMEAAMATSTAPPMAAEIYACTAACNKQAYHSSAYHQILQERNKSPKIKQPTQIKTQAEEGSRLPPALAAEIWDPPDRARGRLLKRRRRGDSVESGEAVRWPVEGSTVASLATLCAGIGERGRAEAGGAGGRRG